MTKSKKKGVIYTYGRDKWLRPIVVLDLVKTDLSKVTIRNLNKNVGFY